MKIVKLNKIEVRELIDYLKEGKVLGVPTETAYGLIADATSRRAVKKIYQMKGRDFKKPLPLICSSLFMVKKFFYVPKRLEVLARKYWPGPLSLQLKVKSKKLKVKMLNGTLVARVSSYELLRKLSRGLNKPITATSANVAGEGEIYLAQKVFDRFKGRKVKPDIIIDGGVMIITPPSTIIGLDKNKVIVIRQGKIKI